MNRIIKFRAWDEIGKQMIEHDNLIMTSDGFSALDEEAVMFPMENIMQFTGLLDKNGKEIYEGDVVRYSMQGDLQYKPMVVDMFNLRLGMAEGDPYMRMDDNFEVIGNIYENPELITQ